MVFQFVFSNFAINPEFFLHTSCSDFLHSSFLIWWTYVDVHHGTIYSETSRSKSSIQYSQFHYQTSPNTLQHRIAKMLSREHRRASQMLNKWIAFTQRIECIILLNESSVHCSNSFASILFINSSKLTGKHGSSTFITFERICSSLSCLNSSTVFV